MTSQCYAGTARSASRTMSPVNVQRFAHALRLAAGAWHFWHEADVRLASALRPRADVEVGWPEPRRTQPRPPVGAARNKRGAA